MSYNSYLPSAANAAPLNTLYKQVYGKTQAALNFYFPEFKNLSSIKKFDVVPSARKMIIPLDVQRSFGVAAIRDGAPEAAASTPALRELEISYSIFSKRFTVSTTSRLLDAKAAAAQIENNLKYSALKAMQAIGADFTTRMYAGADGVIANMNGNGLTGEFHAAATSPAGATLPSITVASFAGASWRGAPTAYVSGVDLGNVSRHLALAFVEGDIIAVVNSVTNAVVQGFRTIREIQALSNGKVRLWLSGLDWTNLSTINSDLTGQQFVVVKANASTHSFSLGNGSDAAKTDYGLSLTGMTDWVNDSTSFALHGLTPAQEPNWTLAVNDRTGGRFTPMRLKRAITEIEYQSGMKADTVLWSSGVARDITLNQSQILRYDDPSGLELIQNPTARGLTLMETRSVPAGECLVYAKDAIGKLEVSGIPGQPGDKDLRRMENVAGFVASIEHTIGLGVKVRKGLAFFANLTEV